MTVCRLLVAVLLLGTGVHSCSPAVGWEFKSLEVRARQPEWIVYGIVLTDEMPVPSDVGDQESTYTLKPECWLKHDFSGSNVTFTNITILEQKWDCVTVPLRKGNNYIIFLGYENGQFIVDNVNAQPGAINQTTDQDFGAVYRGIIAGTDELPDESCLDGVDIPCFVEGFEEELCDHGVVVKAAILSVVITSLFAQLFI